MANTTKTHSVAVTAAEQQARNDAVWASQFGVRKFNARRTPVGSYYVLVQGVLRAGAVVTVRPVQTYFVGSVMRLRRKPKRKDEVWTVITFGPDTPGGRNWLVGERLV